MTEMNFTKYEKARILGARALQIAMNAPLLIKISQDDLEKMNFDALKIAEVELESGVLPITVDKPLPEMKGAELKRAKEIKLTEKQKKELEAEDEKDVIETGQMMSEGQTDDSSTEGNAASEM